MNQELGRAAPVQADMARLSKHIPDSCGKNSSMRVLIGSVLMGGLFVAATVVAQPPPGRDGGGRGERAAGDFDSFLSRLMAFDANQDGKLAKDEVKDARLHALFDRADADKDGVATRDELTALFHRESAALAQGGRGGPGAGPGAPGGPGGRGFGGPVGPGQVLPPFLQEALNLTDAQRRQVEELQQDVDAKLAKILTEAQRQQLREVRERGPGFGPGGPGGRPGPDARPGTGGPNQRPQPRN
jgi:hypothetical protein